MPLLRPCVATSSYVLGNVSPGKVGLQLIHAHQPALGYCSCWLQVKAFVNEAHLFNDACILFDVWPPARPNLQLPASQAHTQKHQLRRNIEYGQDEGVQVSKGVCSSDSTDEPPSCGQAAPGATTPHDPPVIAMGICALEVQHTSKGMLLIQRVWSEVLNIAAGT